MLYSWRERFFQHHFPISCWYTDGADDSHDLDTVPFQVTTNFDCLMAMAAGMRYSKDKGEKIYLENDEEISNSVKKKWDVNQYDFDDYDFDDYFGDTEHYNELSFSTTIHKIAELHLKGPKKLEELAMRSVIRNGIPLAEMSRELKKKCVEGMYDLEDDAPEHIDDEWKECFEHVKRSFIKMKAGENFTSSSKTIHFGSGCTISPEELVETDSEEKERELLILAQMHADMEMERIKTKLENIKNQRELFLARSNAGQDQKKSKRGPPRPGSSNQGPGLPQ